MAQQTTRRIRPTTLQSDRNAYTAVHQLPDYKPANTAYSPAALAERMAAMEAARNAEIKAQNALDAARDAAVAAEWAFHDAMLGTKDQVVAQYGSDSDAVQALGLKKKSERKRPTRRAPAKELV